MLLLIYQQGAAEPAVVGAGASRGVAVERNGKIRFFDTQDEADFWLSSLEVATAAIEKAKAEPATETTQGENAFAAVEALQRVIDAIPEPVQVEYEDVIGRSRRAIRRAKKKAQEEDDEEALLMLL